MQENLISLFNAIEDLLFLLDEHGTIMDVNQSAEKTLGYFGDALRGKNIRELVSNPTEEFKLNSKEHSARSVELKGSNGNLVKCLYSVKPIQLNEQPQLLFSAINISPLKDAEEKISKNLTQQTILADISQHFLSLDDFEGKVNYTLNSIGKHSGVSRVYIFEDSADGNFTSNTYEWCNEGVSAQIDELQGVPYEIIPSWKQILINEGRVFSTNIQELPSDILAILEPQGIKSILILPLYVENQFFGFIGFDECEKNKNWETEEIELLRTIAGIISNAFERRLFQKKLSDSEIRLKLAIENTETSLWDWNVQTGELYFNDVWRKMLGYANDEIEPTIKAWEELLHPEDKKRVWDELDKHLTGKIDYYATVHRLRTRKGGWKWVYDKGKIVEYDSSQQPSRMIGTYIDIHRQKITEEELRDLNITKDKLFSIIGHDLRGLIGSIMQISEMVSEKNALDEETLFQFLRSQKELSQNTFQLLDNLLNWARFNLEQIQYHPKKINLCQLFNEAITGVKYKAEQKGINLVSDCSEPVYAFADEEMVRIIIRNILNNAIKFTRSGSIHLSLKELKEEVEIEIKDTGVGIPEENLTKILSDNEYFTTRGTSNENGSGLGLKLCKNFIQQNKGILYIESVKGTGTTFRFTLPKNKIEIPADTVLESV